LIYFSTIKLIVLFQPNSKSKTAITANIFVRQSTNIKLSPSVRLMKSKKLATHTAKNISIISLKLADFRALTNGRKVLMIVKLQVLQSINTLLWISHKLFVKFQSLARIVTATNSRVKMNILVDTLRNRQACEQKLNHIGSYELAVHFRSLKTNMSLTLQIWILMRLLESELTKFKLFSMLTMQIYWKPKIN
jgi:hypothetical protein